MHVEKIPGDRVSQRNSFLYSHWCIFCCETMSESIDSGLAGSSYTGLSWAAPCPYLTLLDIFSPQCWHKFLPTKQFKWACDKRYFAKRANILCRPVSGSFHGRTALRVWLFLFWIFIVFPHRRAAKYCQCRTLQMLSESESVWGAEANSSTQSHISCCEEI